VIEAADPGEALCADAAAQPTPMQSAASPTATDRGTPRLIRGPLFHRLE
jgi:hypothetical protein